MPGFLIFTLWGSGLVATGKSITPSDGSSTRYMGDCTWWGQAVMEALGFHQVHRVKSSATKQLLRFVVWFLQWCSDTDIQHWHPVQFVTAHTEGCGTHVPPLWSSCEKGHCLWGTLTGWEGPCSSLMLRSCDPSHCLPVNSLLSLALSVYPEWKKDWIQFAM